jgi:hypothetical protein
MQHICMHSPAVREHALQLVRAGLNDCEVARRTGISRSTIRDWRRPRYERQTPNASNCCPRCWRPSPLMGFTPGDYAELLGLYLGDGHIVHMPRTRQLRLFLDSRYPGIVRDAEALLRRCFMKAPIGKVFRHDGRMTVLGVYGRHIPCVLPQHGPGKKHERPITLEPWQQRLVALAPWQFLRGCIRSDGCVFINRTGQYEYLSYDFSNHSSDILDLFANSCDEVGVEHRRYARRIRINRRESVALMRANVGLKR